MGIFYKALKPKIGGSMINFVYIGSDAFEWILFPDIGGLPPVFRVKIGRTSDPISCLRQLRRGNPSFLFLHFWFIPERAVEVESALHRRYAPWNITNEWFSFTIEELAVLESFPASQFGDRFLGYLPLDISPIPQPTSP